mmetsp:Transcript_52988/g.161002  ORF Transcript_52988/g.161002 Transcript_52988/m.161002 type:complete len:275 (+) Transcript_52988:618-1442(+)
MPACRGVFHLHGQLLAGRAMPCHAARIIEGAFGIKLHIRADGDLLYRQDLALGHVRGEVARVQCRLISHPDEVVRPKMTFAGKLDRVSFENDERRDVVSTDLRRGDDPLQFVDALSEDVVRVAFAVAAAQSAALRLHHAPTTHRGLVGALRGGCRRTRIGRAILGSREAPELRVGSLLLEDGHVLAVARLRATIWAIRLRDRVRGGEVLGPVAASPSNLCSMTAGFKHCEAVDARGVGLHVHVVHRPQVGVTVGLVEIAPTVAHCRFIGHHVAL